MLFNFSMFVQELRENPEKKEAVEKYETLVEPITGDTRDQKWYQEYTQWFQTTETTVPKEIEKDFDWDLLQQLAASSFSTEADLEVHDHLVELLFAVQSGETIVHKRLSELWGFQVLRLYEIYCEESMNLHILIHEDENEKEAIEAQRKYRLQRWRQKLVDLERKKIVGDAAGDLEGLL
jgi:hypothetical protein